jgi:hypothetical protein
MRVPEQSGSNSCNKKPLNEGIGLLPMQPRVDSYLYQTQTSRQLRIYNAILKDIKNIKHIWVESRRDILSMKVFQLVLHIPFF